jgi:hypothetical protein
MVLEPINFVDTATVQTAKEHQSVVVRCEVEGDPEPSVMWTVKGKEPKGKWCIFAFIHFSLQFERSLYKVCNKELALNTNG